MEIKEGNYIRTRKGIAKIIEDCGEYLQVDKSGIAHDCCFNEYVEKKDIWDVRENIIDLIEVGDYVNGLRINSITEVDKSNDVRLVWHLNTYGDDDISFSNEEIKSIVTKEQFNSVKYEVE